MLELQIDTKKGSHCFCYENELKITIPKQISLSLFVLMLIAAVFKNILIALIESGLVFIFLCETIYWSNQRQKHGPKYNDDSKILLMQFPLPINLDKPDKHIKMELKIQSNDSKQF